MRTCLIDGDFHRPRVHELFAVPRDPGFADILGKDFSVESVLKSTRYETLKVIPAGGRYAFPSELLLPDRLAAVFGKLRLLFDLIVVDAPPLLPARSPRQRPQYCVLPRRRFPRPMRCRKADTESGGS